jgi:hypothetical protein
MLVAPTSSEGRLHGEAEVPLGALTRGGMKQGDALGALRGAMFGIAFGGALWVALAGFTWLATAWR